MTGAPGGPTAAGSLTVLRNARSGGRTVDVVLDPAAGTIRDVLGSGSGRPPPGATVVDLDGFLLLPAPAEPHAHLDKALLADRVPNATGDLAGAIEAMHMLAPSITHDDLVARAREAALMALANGTTAIRSHADVGSHTGLRHVAALLEVRDSLSDVMTIQVVSLTSSPLGGPAGVAHARLLHEALAMGADVAGGCPHLDDERVACMTTVLDAAEAAGVPVDLHMDENTDPASRDLAALAADVAARRFPLPVTASHCVSLGIQPPDEARRTAAAVADAGIAVVANPQTNLYLQGRDQPVATPRGLTAVRALLDAGAVVAGGGDNVRDPFNPMGRADALEIASLLVTAGHLLPHEAFAAVTDGARRAMGLPVVTVAPGSVADLLAVRAASLTEAIAAAPPDRLVFSRGRLVAETRSTRTFHGLAIPAAHA